MPDLFFLRGFTLIRINMFVSIGSIHEDIHLSYLSLLVEPTKSTSSRW